MRRFVLGCLIAAGSLTAATSGAQNAVQNGGLATALPPWESFGGFGLTGEWSSVDAAGNPNSGSLLGTLPAGSQFPNGPYAFQCVVVQANTRYVFGGKVLRPSATSPVGGNASISVEAFSNTQCGGNTANYVFSASESSQDAWMPIRDLITTGPGELSLQFYVRGYAPMGAAQRVYFDDLFVSPDILFQGRFE